MLTRWRVYPTWTKPDCFSSLSWHTSPSDDPKLEPQETIWDAILSLGPNILDLTIEADTLEVPLNNIELLTNLESMSLLSMPMYDTSPSVVSAVSKLYFSSPTLKSITIRKEFSDPCLLSIHMPSGPPSLRHLDLTNCFIPFYEPTTLSRLSNLTSLTYSIFRGQPDSKYSPEKMWMALKASGIQLEELVVREGAVTASLVDYLTTISGLKILLLSLIASSSPTGTAAQFWSAAFPNHTNTLEEFALYAGDESEWCFSTQNCPLIVQCTRLMVLNLCISSQPGQDLVPNKLILDDAVSGFPHFKTASSMGFLRKL